MRLTWNEIRARAADFSREWADAVYEKGETQSFYDEFFHVFGIRRRSVGSFEQAVKKLGGGQGFIDLFWPGLLLVEQKSAGRDLGKAGFQAMDYVHALKPAERPRYVLLSDFQTFRLIDLSERKETEFPLKDLSNHVQKFGFMLGVERRSFKDQDPVNIKAAELVGKLHDALEEGGFEGEDLEVFLVRIVFCLFADDTGVFEEKDIFLRWLKERTSEDGSDLGPKLSQLFQTLDKPRDKRAAHLDESLNDFPYINGRLFEGRTDIPSFNSEMRNRLIEACEFDWTPISPAIFGSLFQSVMEKDERRKFGAHYTTEKNIMKVIEPLFLDDLRAELEHAKGLKRGRANALDKLSTKLGKLTFFDPACGCGNFLIIAYRELRRMEIELLKARFPAGTTMQLDARDLSNINVDQFYGIEIGEFAAKIAETAMWMMDHIMNNELSLAFGQTYARIPLDKAATIICNDALEVNWADVLPAEDCDYLLGNPPFIGAKYQEAEQRAQVREIADMGKKAGTLDYVCAWFLKAGAYVNEGGTDPAHIAFVSTNSITQGEQVAQLWPILFDRYQLEIAFAHRTFEWGSDARGKAHVHVVIIGLSHRVNVRREKRLFSYENIKGEPEEVQPPQISPYLISADTRSLAQIVVKSVSNPVSDVPKVVIGSKPIDGGNLILSREELDILSPKERPFAKPYIGSREFLNGGDRHILTLQKISPGDLREMPSIIERLQAVRAFREASKSAPTRAIAQTPTEYHVTTIPDDSFLVLPKVSSERRPYLPIGWLEPPIVPSDLLQVVTDAEMHQFSILSSAAHMAWMRAVAGRLKSDYRYTIGVVYNTFPWPDLTDAAKAKLTETGQAILDARAAWPDATLADLYDPVTMPPNLRKAHQANDKAVDRLYHKKPFESERERVEHLFALYEKLSAPVLAAAKPKPKRRRKRIVKTS